MSGKIRKCQYVYSDGERCMSEATYKCLIYKTGQNTNPNQKPDFEVYSCEWNETCSHDAVAEIGGIWACRNHIKKAKQFIESQKI